MPPSHPLLRKLQVFFKKLCQKRGQRLNRTKDAASKPITQEITRVLGILCQELGAETKYIFFICHTCLIY